MPGWSCSHSTTAEERHHLKQTFAQSSGRFQRDLGCVITYGLVIDGGRSLSYEPLATPTRRAHVLVGSISRSVSVPPIFFSSGESFSPDTHQREKRSERGIPFFHLWYLGSQIETPRIIRSEAFSLPANGRCFLPARWPMLLCWGYYIQKQNGWWIWHPTQLMDCHGTMEKSDPSRNLRLDPFQVDVQETIRRITSPSNSRPRGGLRKARSAMR